MSNKKIPLQSMERDFKIDYATFSSDGFVSSGLVSGAGAAVSAGTTAGVG